MESFAPLDDKALGQASHIDTQAVNRTHPGDELHQVAVHGVADAVELFQRTSPSDFLPELILTMLQRIHMGVSPNATYCHGLQMTPKILWCVSLLRPPP